MNTQFDRLEKQIGKHNLEILQQSHVAVFGLGGVGGNTVETLARSGIGEITIVDKDIFDITNLNRQILCTYNDIGKNKVDICVKRLKSINPEIKIHHYNIQYPDSNCNLDFSQFNYVIDAIDDTNAKIEIIKKSKQNNVPIISCLGTGNKFNPLDLRVIDIKDTHTCPLAKSLREKLKKLQITNVKCIFSIEKPIKNIDSTITSNAFVPNVAGILLAREVILDLIHFKENK